MPPMPDYNEFPAWCRRCGKTVPPRHGLLIRVAVNECVVDCRPAVMPPQVDAAVMDVRDELQIERVPAIEHTTAAEAIPFVRTGGQTGRYTSDPLDLPQGAQAVIDPSTGFTKIRRKHPPVVSGSHRVSPSGRLEVRTLNGDWAEVQMTTGSSVCPTNLIEMPSLSAGDTVYEKITGRGPYVLVERAEVEIESEAPSRRPGETRLATVWVATWMVRDRHGSYLSIPEAVLTTTAPIRSRPWRHAPRVVAALLRAAFCAIVFPVRLVIRLAARPRRTKRLPPPCPTCPPPRTRDIQQ